MAEALWERVSEARPASSTGTLVGVMGVVHGGPSPRAPSGGPTPAMLIVADLHLEKGSSFARRGQLIPPYDTHETLGALARLIRALQPQLCWPWAIPSTTTRPPRA